MIFPIGDDQVKGGVFPIFSYLFIAINVLVFLVVQLPMAPESAASFFDNWGSVPSKVVQGEGIPGLFTSMFLHGGFMHLLGNMLFLWVFGDNIEASIGNIKYVIFYLLGGLAASGLHIYFFTESNVPAIGASGAISAILGAYLVMYPKSRIKVLVFFFFVNVPAVLFLGYWFWQQWSGVFTPSDGASGIAWWAHIGGFIFGLLGGLYYRLSGQVFTLHQQSETPSPRA